MNPLNSITAGIVGGVVLVPATDEQKAAARMTTLYATRANFILSVPLLLSMSSAGHGLPF
jgi:hypothetical protein